VPEGMFVVGILGRGYGGFLSSDEARRESGRKAGETALPCGSCAFGTEDERFVQIPLVDEPI